MLSTIDELIDALGGPSKVALIGGVGLTAVSNWRSRGKIPAEKFMLFSAALSAMGKTAAPALFGFEPAEVRT